MIVNEEYDILHLSDRAGRYLQFAGGEPSHNLLRAVRPELRIELRSALYIAAQERAPVDARGLSFDDDGRRVTVDVSVRPVLREERRRRADSSWCCSDERLRRGARRRRQCR